jgi:Lipase (class 3)
MISDLALANLCAALYQTDEGWTHYDDGAYSDGVCWAVKDVGDVSVIVLRGSVIAEDWRRDFQAFASPLNHDDLGPVHPGFLSGMRTVQCEVEELIPIGGNKIIITGHSLGAARASILTGLLRLTPRRSDVVRRVVFGEPRPGFQRLAGIVSEVSGVSYRNVANGSHDLVTDVPFSVPPENYVHPTSLIDVSAAPDDDLVNRWGAFALHHIGLYIKALET